MQGPMSDEHTHYLYSLVTHINIKLNMQLYHKISLEGG